MMRAGGHRNKALRLGAGAGFAGDRIEPAVELALRGNLDYLVFECLAERTIALAQQRRRLSPELGYDPQLEARLLAILPVRAKNAFRIVTNMGAANPAAAARLAREIARDLGLRGLRIAFVDGDDVLSRIEGTSACFMESGDPVDTVSGDIIAANAYLGAAPISDALAQGADLVICGRVSDPALYLGPLIHEFGWPMTGWDLLASGTLAGHMLECAGQVSGGYFADPGYKDVPGLASLGFPVGDVAPDGSVEISILPGSGGFVTPATCKEQLLYEIGDPARYLQPDVVADFSEVRVQEVATNRVRLHGARGAPRPDNLKVSVAYRDGFTGEGQISYCGSGAAARAELAGNVIRERLAAMGIRGDDLRIDLIGLDSLCRQPPRHDPASVAEVRLRVVARTRTRGSAEAVANEVEALYTNGPSGGGGVAKAIREVVAIQSLLLPRGQVQATVTMLEA